MTISSTLLLVTLLDCPLAVHGETLQEIELTEQESSLPLSVGEQPMAAADPAADEPQQTLMQDPMAMEKSFPYKTTPLSRASRRTRAQCRLSRQVTSVSC